jgi:hypothetical protein
LPSLRCSGMKYFDSLLFSDLDILALTRLATLGSAIRRDYRKR